MLTCEHRRMLTMACDSEEGSGVALRATPLLSHAPAQVVPMNTSVQRSNSRGVSRPKIPKYESTGSWAKLWQFEGVSDSIHQPSAILTATGCSIKDGRITAGRRSKIICCEIDATRWLPRWPLVSTRGSIASPPPRRSSTCKAFHNQYHTSERMKQSWGMNPLKKKKPGFIDKRGRPKTKID